MYGIRIYELICVECGRVFDARAANAKRCNGCWTEKERTGNKKRWAGIKPPSARCESDSNIRTS